MKKMNMDILKIFKKFNYRAYPVKQLIICMHKFKFKDEKRNNEQTIMQQNSNHSFQPIESLYSIKVDLED